MNYTKLFLKYFGKVDGQLFDETYRLERVPTCNYKNCSGKLILVNGNEPWSDAHLQCELCDSTYRFINSSEK